MDIPVNLLTLALLKTEGKYDSSQDRAVAIIKYINDNIKAEPEKTEVWPGYFI